MILTSDYEVWGNGSGCVERCVIDPAKEMLDIANRYNARLTFFLDVCEYWAFDETEASGKFENDYKPATYMREQLQEAVREGHDVQLHFHPQWLNYKCISNQVWELDYRYWRLPEVSHYHTSEWKLHSLFEKGKKTLFEMFGECREDYNISAFRAGAWCIQPEGEILDILKDLDIKIDSTVAPGRREDDGTTLFDFTHASKIPFWSIGDSVLEPGSGSVLEIPIFTQRIGLLKLLYFLSLRKMRRIPVIPSRCDRVVNERLQKGFISKINSARQRMLNFSDATVFEEMKFLTLQAIGKYSGSGGERIPIVAISHPKTFANGREFDKYLSWVSKRDDVSFARFGDFLDLDKFQN